jgi:hypothetical protein
MKLWDPRMAWSKYQVICGANTPYTRANSALDAIPIPDWYESLRKAPNTYHTGEFWQLATQK